MSGGEPEMVHQPGDVVGPHFHVIVLERPLGLAVAAHVEIDAAESPRQHRRGGGEIKMSEAGAVDLDDGFAFAGLLVPDTRAIDPGMRHCVSLKVRAPSCWRYGQRRVDGAYAHSPVVLKPAARPLLAAIFNSMAERNCATSAAVSPPTSGTSGKSVRHRRRVQRNAGGRFAAGPTPAGKPSGVVNLTRLPHFFVTTLV